MPPAPSPGMGTSSEAQAPGRNLFPFNHKPNTLDRDRIVVPAGWDSWGKITVMRDGFDAKMWGEAWEKDLEVDGGGEGGAKRLYTTLVPDQGQKVSHCQICVCCFSKKNIHGRSFSHHHFLHLTIRPQSKRSWPRTTTRTPKSQIEILVVLSGTQQISLVLRLVLLAPLGAVALIFRTWYALCLRWKLELEDLHQSLQRAHHDERLLAEQLLLADRLVFQHWVLLDCHQHMVQDVRRRHLHLQLARPVRQMEDKHSMNCYTISSRAYSVRRIGRGQALQPPADPMLMATHI